MEKKSIYIMQHGKMCKIGVSKNPIKRLNDIQIGNPKIELIFESTPILNAYEIEKYIHKIYKDTSVGREWFVIEDVRELVSLLKEIVQSDGIFHIKMKKGENSSELLDEIICGEIKRLQEEIQNIRQETFYMKEENERVNDFLYCIFGNKNESDYTNLIYRTLFEKSAKDLEKEYGVKPRENLRDYFTGEELAQVQSMEMLISSLINCGWGYEEIKKFVQEQSKKMIS